MLAYQFCLRLNRSQDEKIIHSQSFHGDKKQKNSGRQDSGINDTQSEKKRSDEENQENSGEFKGKERNPSLNIGSEIVCILQLMQFAKKNKFFFNYQDRQ